MTIQTQRVDYQDEGNTLEGFFAYDDGIVGLLPTVLICHAWRGRDQFVCDKAVKLAGMGYAAFALDMYGKGVLGGDVEENSKLMQPFMDDRLLLQRRISVALTTVRALDRVDEKHIAAIGFCFGGLCALDLARTGADIQGVVSFHGLLAAPGNTQGKPIKTKVLVMHGHDDPMVPIEDILALKKELTEAGADWQMHVYGHTMHAFTNPVANDPNFGTVYDEKSDARSWQSLQNFLDEVLGKSPM